MSSLVNAEILKEVNNLKASYEAGLKSIARIIELNQSAGVSTPASKKLRRQLSSTKISKRNQFIHKKTSQND